MLHPSLQQIPNRKQDNQLTNKLVNTLVLGSVQPKPEGISPMEELNLNYKKNDTKDINELRQILCQILSYPSSEIALLHMKANRLGDLDLKQTLSDQQSNTQNYKQISQNAKFCPCCGFIVQDSTLSICTNVEDISHLGISTFLYFETLKNIIRLLAVHFFVFCIYALVSNVIAADSYRKSVGESILDPALLSFQGFLAISLGSKQIHQTENDKISYTVQCWLGVAVLVIWGLLFGIIKHMQRNKSIGIDRDSKTASDFTILIKNFPSEMTKQQLQNELLQYQQNLGQIFLHQAKTPIQIAKINMATPFYLNYDDFDEDSLKELNQEYKSYREKYVEWIKERIQEPEFRVGEEERAEIKKKFMAIKEKRANQYKRIAAQIKKDIINRQAEQTVPTFVTFSNSYNKQFLQFMHEDSNRLINSLPCANKNKYFHFKKIGNKENVMAEIKEAPEPEDIIWTNQGQSSSSYYKKRVVTFGISVLVLGASFGSIYGLSKVQSDYAKTHTDASNQYISILISLCISIINIIIQQILRFLTKIERNATYTQHQSSLGLKAVIALIINSILIPILVNYFFKQNLYGVNGLAYDVFYLGITNSFLSPILKIFDIYYFFTRFWRWYKDTPIRKIPLNQNQLNTISEYMEFQIGYEYIYIVNLFLFTCFFSPLQPIIVVFAIAGLFIMFWAQKYSLFNRCKRPSPGLNLVNNTMYQLIYLGPACFTLGSFCWSNFFKQNFIGIAPNLTAAIISGIIFLLPYRKLVKACFSYEPEVGRTFQQDRLFMPSQYDRLNPSTSASGIEDYKKYLLACKQKIAQKKFKNPQQFQQFEKLFFKQYGLGGRHNQPIIPELVTYMTPGNGSYNENQLVLQELFGTNQNVFNPYLIGHAMLNDQQQLNVAVQNWFTNEEAQTVTYQNQNNNRNENPNKFGYKMTESFLSPNQGEQVTYNQKNMLPSQSGGGINILYSDLLQPKQTGKNKLPPIQEQRQSIPLNIPFNIFGAFTKLVDDQPATGSEGNRNTTAQNRGNVMEMGEMRNGRYVTNDNKYENPGFNTNTNPNLNPNPPKNNSGGNGNPYSGNLFQQISQPKNYYGTVPYDPYGINLHSQDNLSSPNLGNLVPGLIPNPIPHPNPYSYPSPNPYRRN